jgi:hypothetical protein
MLQTVRLEECILDKNNPRFIVSENRNDENSIFLYMKNNEVLDELVKSIILRGFYKIGERPIAILSDSKYVILEGNRRICALKYIHGFYSQSFEHERKNEIIDNTTEIEVELVESIESIQSYLATKHIEGIRMWKPEAKRNFYSKHYIIGRSIAYIKGLTDEKEAKIKSYIAEYMFLEYFKSKSGAENIDKPSFIYERIYRYLIKMGIVNKINVQELISQTIIEKGSLIREDEIELFYNDLKKAIIDDSILDSRTANTELQFITLLKSQDFKENYTNLFDITKLTLDRKLKKDFIPSLKLNKSIVTKVPPINQIINLTLLDDPTIEIKNCNNEVLTVEGFQNSGPGFYQIKVNDITFNHEIIDFLTPKLISKNHPDIIIDNPYSLRLLFTIFDPFNTILDLNDPNIRISTETQNIELLTNGEFKISLANTAQKIKVKYSFPDRDDLSFTKIIEVNAKPLATTDTNSNVVEKYFTFRRIENTCVANDLNISARLITELEEAFSREYYYVFASALRSLIEVRVFEYTEFIRNNNNSSRFASMNTFSSIFTEFINCFNEPNFFKDISSQYKRLMRQRGVFVNDQELKNYFEANLSVSTFNQMKGTLHLGAHKSMTLIQKSHLNNIKSTLCAFLELIYTMVEINY